MTRRLGIMMTAMLACCLVQAEAANSYDDAVKELVAKLVKRFPHTAAEKQQAIAVGWFAQGASKYTGRIGDLLARDVRAELLRSKRLKVVTLDVKPLDEIKFAWMTDSIDPETAPRAPKGFTAFTLLLRGQYYADIRKDTVTLRAQIVDVAKGELVSAEGASFERNDSPIPLDAKELGNAEQLANEMQQAAQAVKEKVEVGGKPLPPPQQKVRVRLWTEGFRKIYQEGEKVRFRATVDRDAFLFLFNLRADGSTVLLYPNAYHPDNLVKAGQVVAIPSDAMKFDLVVEPPYGDEAVQGIATTSREAAQAMRGRGIDNLRPAAQAPPRGVTFRGIDGGARNVAEIIRDVRVRGIGVRPRQEGGQTVYEVPAWAENSWSLRTLPKKRPQ